jgi:hypothetical protein
MSQVEERDGRLYLSGYLDAQIIKNETRKYGYPENGLPELKVKFLVVESCITVALKRANESTPVR